MSMVGSVRLGWDAPITTMMRLGEKGFLRVVVKLFRLLSHQLSFAGLYVGPVRRSPKRINLREVFRTPSTIAKPSGVACGAAI